MDVKSAKVLGSIALVFVSTSIVRHTCSDVDLLLVLLNTTRGVLWLGAEVWLRRFGTP